MFRLIKGKHSEINFEPDNSDNGSDPFKICLDAAQKYHLVVHATINGINVDIYPWSSRNSVIDAYYYSKWHTQKINGGR